MKLLKNKYVDYFPFVYGEVLCDTVMLRKKALDKLISYNITYFLIDAVSLRVTCLLPS